jgi:hypothetical protein
MNTLFDPRVYQDTLRRIESLQPTNQRQWGRMSAAQMLEHLARVVEMAAGKTPTRQRAIGKAISWIFKKRFVGPGPFQRNAPTAPDFVVRTEPDFVKAKQRLVALLGELHGLGEHGCEGNVHAFFGTLTGAEWGLTQYKHLDHHLRQFSA